jgi:hypothetical protein
MPDSDEIDDLRPTATQTPTIEELAVKVAELEQRIEYLGVFGKVV